MLEEKRIIVLGREKDYNAGREKHYNAWKRKAL